MIEVSLGVKNKSDTFIVNFDGTKEEAKNMYGLQSPLPVPPIDLPDGTWVEIAKDQVAWVKIKEIVTKEEDNGRLGEGIPE